MREGKIPVLVIVTFIIIFPTSIMISPNKIKPVIFMEFIK